MATIVTRETTQTDGTSPKGSPLTNAEVDTNFINLNDNKVEVSGAIIFQAKAGEALAKGDVVYVSGVSGNEPIVSKADADDANKMPAYGLAEDAANLNAAVNVVTFGTLYDLNTSSFTAGDNVYVSTTAGALSGTPPTGESSLIQNVGTVIRSHASAGSIKVGGAGRTNATPNLNDGNVFIGNASNQAAARALTAADIQSGTFADARIAQSNVTQHQAALSITESQISDLQTYLTAESDTLDSVTGRGATTSNAVTVGNLTSTGIDDNATSTAITIDSSQRVGIGATSLSHALQVGTSASGQSLGLYSSSYASNGMVRFYGTDSVERLQIGSLSATAAYLYTPANTDLTFYTGGSQNMTLDASGNLLVGLTSGQDALIHAQAPKSTYTDYATVFAGGTDSNNGQHGISLATAGNSLAGIVGSNVSIDGSTFSQPTTARSSGYFLFSNGTTAGKTSTLTYTGFAKGTTTPVERFRVDENGTLRIGPETAGQASLEFKVNGSSYSEIESINFGLNYNMPLILQRQGGNVGIGGSPDAKLNVVSDVTPSSVDTYGSVIIASNTGSLGPRLNIAASSSTENSYLWSVNRGYNYTNIVMQEHGGNVGVGTETINERLVSVGAIRALGATTSNEPSATLSWNGTAAGLESRGPDLSTRGKINLYQAASNGSLGQTALHIDASGNVIVGSTTANAAGAVTINQDGDITQVSPSGVASSSLFGAISGVSNGFQIQSTASNTHIYTLLNGSNVAMKIADGKVMVNTGTSSSNKKLIVAVDPASTSDDGIQFQDPANTNFYGTLGLTGSAYTYRNVPANQIMLYGGGKGISFLTDGSPLPITFHDSTGEYARFNAQKFSLGATTTNSPFAVHTIRGQKAFCGNFVHNSSGITTDILRLHSLAGNVTVGISIKLRACNAITNQYCIIEFHASAHRTGGATPTLSVTTPSITVPINTAPNISGGGVTWDSSTLTLKYTSSFSVSYWSFSVEADVMAHDSAGCTFLV